MIANVRPLNADKGRAFDKQQYLGFVAVSGLLGIVKIIHFLLNRFL